MAKRGPKPKQSNAIFEEYSGFTVREQMEALEECKQRQIAKQEGGCAVCNGGLDGPGICWISGGGGDSLRKWTQGTLRSFDPVRMVNVYRKRSPAEIREEYQGGQYFLCHHGCMIKARCTRYSLRVKPVQELYLSKCEALGITRDNIDPSTACELWRKCQEEVEDRAKRRMKEVSKLGIAALMKANPEYGTGKWREYKKKPKGPRPFSPKNPRVRPALADVPAPVATAPATPNQPYQRSAADESQIREAQEFFAEEARHELERPETDMEREAREFVEQMTAMSQPVPKPPKTKMGLLAREYVEQLSSKVVKTQS